ncbi:ABC transporter substrate-binding protein [Waltera sp.]|jgi:raffinose/stachyose/melibiose transport system substrate-binding protein|uniref:ABC transporter substrate-binding protein n=1 Tax=Waltera sp. TaxID=2815806 RepID=UPI003AB2CC39
MRKKLVALFMCAAMAASIAGCGNSSEGTDTTTKASAEEGEDTTTAKASAEEEENTAAATASADEEGTGSQEKKDVTISFMASQDWIQEAEMELAEKFTEETGIKVDYQIVPSDQYVNLLTTKLNTGEATDIFAAQSGKFDIVAQFNVEKNAMDLSGESWAANVEELAAAELTVDGKLYGQPIQDVSAVWAVGYNKKIFADLNLEVPADYASFMDVCQKIKDSGVTPIYEAVSDGWHHTLWFPETCIAAEKAEPGLAEKLNNNEAVFAENETMTTILEQIKEMADKGYWGENYMSNEYANAAKNIASGEYAMAIVNQGFGEEVEAVGGDLKKDDIGYFVMPLADNQVKNVNPAGPSRFVFSGSQHPEEAKQFLEYLASEESLKYLTENVPKFNKLPYKNAPDTYEGSVKEFYDAYTEESTVYQTAVKYVNPQWGEIGADLSAMLVGDIEPKDVLADIDKLRAEQAQAASDEAWK